MNGYRMSNKTREGTTYLPPSNVKIPDTVDWRKEGYVTPVKNQVGPFTQSTCLSLVLQVEFCYLLVYSFGRQCQDSLHQRSYKVSSHDNGLQYSQARTKPIFLPTLELILVSKFCSTGTMWFVLGVLHNGVLGRSTF